MKFSARLKQAWSVIRSGNWHQMFNRPGLADTSSAAKTSKPFAQSVWVNAACSTIANPIKALPLEWRDREGNPAAPDLDRETFWSRPALSPRGRLSWTSFMEASVIWYLLEGEAIWLLDDTWLDRSTRKSPLIIARPDRLRCIMRAGEVVGWQYQDGAGARHQLLPEQVIITAAFNPYSETRGLGKLQAASVAIDADYAAGLFAKFVAQSNGDRGVYIIAKNGIVDDAQKEQIERSLREKRELNQRGIYKASFLTGDVTVEDPKIQTVDQAFLNQRIENRHEIFAAFGVPMSMADIMASYSVGSASDRYRLKEDTCMPVATDLLEQIERVEALRTGTTGLQPRQDWSRDSTFREVREGRLKIATQMHSRAIPWDVINDNLDLGLPAFPGSDLALAPMSLQPLGSHQDDAGPQDGDTSSDTDPDVQLTLQRACSNIETLLQQRQNKPKSAPQSPQSPDAAVQTLGCSHNAAAAPASSLQERDDETPEQKRRRKLWEAHMAARSGSLKTVRAQITKTLNEARKEVLANLADIDLDGRTATPDYRQRGLVDIIFDLATFTTNLVSRLQGAITGTVATAAEQLGEELGLTDPWLTEDQLALDFFATRENKIKGAAQDIFDEIAATIRDGLEEGDGNKEIAQRLRAKFTGISKGRALTIAQTEVTAAYGHARQAGFEALGVTTKEWLSSRDGRVRPSHVAADGQRVGVGDTFEVGEAHLTGPGDTHGPAKEVINCRCVAIAVD
jgi:SPP1 gp7 family putative phage head morphogenesis protein